ncbi:MAG: RNA polymerase sigma factor [Bacteroidetes bacterium]|nr:RNA polymerase sigma factor [Bacteroidota bacterium]
MSKGFTVLGTLSMREYSESEFVAQLLNSSTRDQAFKELINQYKEPLYWHIRGIVLIHEDADDVLQNTFVKVFKNIQGFREQSKLYTWIFRIATNEALSFLKKMKKNRGISLDYEINPKGNNRLLADPHFNPDQAHKSFVQIISTLPEQQRSIFSMRYFQDMKFKDIAQILELSIGGVKSSYHIAQKKIKNQLLDKTFLS